MKLIDLNKAVKGLVCILALICHTNQAKNFPMYRDFYYLKVTAAHCAVTCYLNGFPVYEQKSVGEITQQIPVNLYLVGQANRFEIRIKPLNRAGKVQASFYRYSEGQIVSPDDAQEDRDVFSVESHGEAKQAVFYFDNEKFDFHHLLSDTRVVRTEQVKVYAETLLESIRHRDVKKLLAEMQPKVHDYSIAFSASDEILTKSLQEELSGILSDEKLKIAAIEDIIPVPYNNGRLWELTIKPGLPFIYIPGETGPTSLKIYVAMVDGTLKIVR